MLAIIYNSRLNELTHTANIVWPLSNIRMNHCTPLQANANENQHKINSFTIELFWVLANFINIY